VPILDLLPRIRAARAALPAMRALETAPRKRIEAEALRLLNATWAHARVAVPDYRDLAEGHGLPDAFDSWEQVSSTIPLLDKTRVRDSPEWFLSADAAPGRWRRTGGSTGDPMRVYWSDRDHLHSLRARYRMLDRWGIDVLDRSAMLWGHGASVAPGLRGRADRLAQPLFDRVRRRLRLSAYALSPADCDAHLDALAHFAPRSLYGYSSAVALLAARAEATGICLPSLDLVILTGEPADSALRAAVSSRLRCPVTVEYGSAETGVMASGAPDGTLLVNEDAVYLETLPTAQGAFEIVVTVLSAPSFPLLRYRIGDVASAPLVRPASGFARLPSVEGRRTDVLVGTQGTILASSALRRVMSEAGWDGRFQAHQAKDGSITLTLEGAKPIHVSDLGSALSRVLERREIRVERTDSLAPNRAGKHRWIINDLAN
jgi:phenylacetate-CoA ligase